MARRRREVSTIKEEPTVPIEVSDFKGNSLAKFDETMVKTIKDTVAKGATDSELYMFLQIASMYDLNPFMKEIWFTKMDNQMAIMTSRDGYLKIAKENPNFKKVQSIAVYENDNFLTKIKNGEITEVEHEFKHTDRGHIVGAYVFLKTKNGDEDLYAYKDFKEHNKKNNVWQKFPEEMIRKVAEADVLKRFATINGLVTEEELNEDNIDEDKGDTIDVESSISSDESIDILEITEE